MANAGDIQLEFPATENEHETKEAQMPGAAVAKENGLKTDEGEAGAKAPEQNEDQTEESPSSDTGDDSTGSDVTTGGSEDEEKGTQEESKTEKEDAGSKDLLLVHDTGFVIKIDAPGIEPFDLPVSSMEMVQEIYQVLIDHTDTCHRTCFSLQLNNTTLDNFAELKTIDGLKEGSVIKVVEETYTVREARIHVRHVRDLLKSIDLTDAYNGLDCNSLAFLNVVTGGDILEKKRGSRPETMDCTPPDYIMPGGKERPLLPLHPVDKEMKSPHCLKVLTYSGWNPPPGNRRMHGDLLYLYIVTVEDKRYHVTASTRGFYINQSTQEEFKPKAAAQHHLSHSLIDLLNQISATFKRNFQVLLKRRAAKHPFERVPTPYQVFSWMAPFMEHSVDAIRAEDAISQRLGYEEHIPGQTRDWNEELQTTRELPRKNLPDRLIRERAIFKVHSDFVVAATRGAMAVIDGNIMAINPGEDAKQQMFLWNNIFFSLGFDVKDHYKDFGGDAASYVAPGNDLQGVKAYASVDPEGLFTLGTVVVDYRGYRVTAQSIIPGILEREQEQSVVYGSIDFGKTVVTHDKYKELLEKTAGALKIRPHKVKNDKGEEVELFSSVECKGIIGNDGRHYVLDLLRTFPPDANYFPVEGEELSPAMKEMGYPLKHGHKLVCLRQELVDAFVESRYMTFVKCAALKFQQLRAKRLAKADKDNEEGDKKGGDEKAITDGEIQTDLAKKIVKEFTAASQNSPEDSSKEIVKMAAQTVGSLSDTEFNITFNTDVFQPHVAHVEAEGSVHKQEKELVKEAAEFLVVHQIPAFIHECLEHQASPIDGYTLTEAMHRSGINMRYLGRVTEMIKKYPQLHYIHIICIGELISRSVKHLFKTYVQAVETTSLAAAVSHFLNCYIGSFPTPHANINTEVVQSHRAKKRHRQRNKNKALASSSGDNHEWALENPKSLWKKIVKEVQDYYHYKISCDGVDAAVERYLLQKVSLLRSFCKKLGVQLLLRDYNVDSKTKAAFGEEDVVNMFPVVKHIHPKATDAYQVFTAGQQKIQQGLLREGYELISEALNLLNNVYGAMHAEISACCRLLARLNYIMGDYGEAMSYQQRAVLMSERVLGIDHPNSLTEYAHLALYCFANNQVPNALRLLYRARYLAQLCHGEYHPEVALLDSNIGLILHAVGEYDLSLRFLQKALELNAKFYGAKSLKVAMSYHLVARADSCKGDFRTALQHEKEAFSIYRQLLGDDHERTKESSECLKHLTQQAVKYQKTLNDIYKGEKNVAIPPLQISLPSLPAVLDTLNLINGIVFLHISPEDIERFREEMMRSSNGGGATSSASKSGVTVAPERKLISPPLSPTESSAPCSLSDSSAKATPDSNSSSVSDETPTLAEVAT